MGDALPLVDLGGDTELKAEQVGAAGVAVVAVAGGPALASWTARLLGGNGFDSASHAACRSTTSPCCHLPPLAPRFPPCSWTLGHTTHAPF